jgi:hypothetical protein
MVTNYPQPMTHSDRLTATHEAETTEGLGWKMWTWMRQSLCGLQGHDQLLQFGQERMSLKCVSCGHESNGWELNEARPTVTVRGDARRHHIGHRQLLTARRIA